MEILSKLLGSVSRVKLIRLFLFNKNKVFSSKEIEKRSNINLPLIRKEIKILSSIHFINKKQDGYVLNSSFRYLKEFNDFFSNIDTFDEKIILNNLKRIGQIKLLLFSGIFIKNKECRIDLFIIAEKINKNKLNDLIKKIEASIGLEISYVLLTKAEFIYRLDMRDKLVRDILDFPYKVIFESKELSTILLKRP